MVYDEALIKLTIWFQLLLDSLTTAFIIHIKVCY